MKRAIQYFTDEYLENCRAMSTADILEFLDGFRELHAGRGAVKPGKSRLISIKIPEELLETFRKRSELEGTPYQTQIKRLMVDWLKK
jgi:uncharacterized protein (DUF4415 family)